MSDHLLLYSNNSFSFLSLSHAAYDCCRFDAECIKTKQKRRENKKFTTLFEKLSLALENVSHLSKECHKRPLKVYLR